MTTPASPIRPHTLLSTPEGSGQIGSVLSVVGAAGRLQPDAPRG